MPDIKFYHLQRQRLEEALPKLMEKVHEAGLRAHIKVSDAGAMDLLDKALWAFDPASFIPHGKEGGAHTHEQPVLLSLGDENLNQATVLVLVNAVECPSISEFDRCLYMFDGRDERIVAKAREDWTRLKDSGVQMSYWQQREAGGWEQKA